MNYWLAGLIALVVLVIAASWLHEQTIRANFWIRRWMYRRQGRTADRAFERISEQVRIRKAEIRRGPAIEYHRALKALNEWAEAELDLVTERAERQAAQFNAWLDRQDSRRRSQPERRRRSGAKGLTDSDGEA